MTTLEMPSVRLTKAEGDGFSLLFPSEWTVTKMSGTVFFVGPRIGPEQVVFSVETYAGDMSLDETLAAVRHAQEAGLDRFAVFAEEDLSTDRYEARSWTSHWYSETSDIVFLQRQVAMRRGGQTWLLTANQPTNDKRNMLDRVFRAMIASFRLDPTPGSP